MAEPFLGQITMFGGNFAPRGWASCEGQLLPINSYSALFSLLGTIYGGDGRTTFALPDLRGRVPMGYGNGPGFTNRRLGERGGSETNTLNVTQLPSHNHVITGEVKVGVADQLGDTAASTDSGLGKFAYDRQTAHEIEMYTTNPTYAQGNQIMGVSNDLRVGNTGNNQGINNIQPYLCVNYIIALQGVFPSRS